MCRWKKELEVRRKAMQGSDRAREEVVYAETTSDVEGSVVVQEATDGARIALIP